MKITENTSMYLPKPPQQPTTTNKRPQPQHSFLSAPPGVIKPAPPGDAKPDKQRPQPQSRQFDGTLLPPRRYESPNPTSIGDLHTPILTAILKMALKAGSEKPRIAEVNKHFLQLLGDELSPAEKATEAGKIIDQDCPPFENRSGINPSIFQRCCAAGNIKRVEYILNKNRESINTGELLSAIEDVVEKGNISLLMILMLHIKTFSININEISQRRFHQSFNEILMKWCVMNGQVKMVELLVSPEYITEFNALTTHENILLTATSYVTSDSAASKKILEILLSKDEKIIVTKELIFNTFFNTNITALEILVKNNKKIRSIFPTLDEQHLLIKKAVESLEYRSGTHWTNDYTSEYCRRLLTVVFDEIKLANNTTKSDELFMKDIKVYALMVASSCWYAYFMCKELIDHFNVDMMTVSGKDEQKRSALRIAMENYERSPGPLNALREVDKKLTQEESRNEIRYAIQKKMVSFDVNIFSDSNMKSRLFVNMIKVVKLSDVSHFLRDAVSTHDLGSFHKVLDLCEKIPIIKDNAVNFSLYALQITAECNDVLCMDVLFTRYPDISLNKVSLQSVLELAISSILGDDTVVVKNKIASVEFLLSKGAKATNDVIGKVRNAMIERSNQSPGLKDMHSEILHMLVTSKQSSLVNRILNALLFASNAKQM